MSQLGDIRNAIAAKLQTIPTLNVTARWDGTVAPPVAIVVPSPSAFLRYGTTMGGESCDISYTIQILASKSLDRVGQEVLDEFLETSGEKSVYAAVSGDLPGTDAHDCQVMEARNYGVVKIGTPPETVYEYLGCEWVVQVFL